jgi:carbonic anhydrase
MVEGSFNMVPGGSVALTLNDAPTGATFENLGTTVEVIMEGSGSTMTMSDGTVYTLQQFHFHHPSEHLDNGVSMPMEMHMVFMSEAGAIGVIGVYVDVDSAAAPGVGKRHIDRRAASPMLETVFASVDAIAEPGTKTTTGPLIMSEVANLVSSGNFQAYSGSLTTPPCSEEVSWMVATNKLTISLETYLRARTILGFNSRYPQSAPGEANLLTAAKGL